MPRPILTITSILLTLILSTGRLAAQRSYTLTHYVGDTMTLTARAGDISTTDTLVYVEGRIGGRFDVYFEGPQHKFFKVDPKLAPKWLGHKLKPHATLKIPIVFMPPPGFTGTAHARMRVQGISGTPWFFVELIGSQP